MKLSLFLCQKTLIALSRFFSESWFCLATQEGNPSILVFEVKSFESKRRFVVYEKQNCPLFCHYSEKMSYLCKN